MKKTGSIRVLIALTIVAAALATYRMPGHSGLNFATAGRIAASAQQTPGQAATGVTLPNARIYALNNDNTIFVLGPGGLSFNRLTRVNRIDGNLIGLDFRPADATPNVVYGLTDAGKLYQINLSPPQLGAATLVSSVSPRFAGGFQSLMDFNPVVNALRLIGSNDQNFALVNSGGNLNVTAVQTAMAYDPGDVSRGADPNIAGGSYTNNVAGAASTLFYAVDYDLDTLVTISSKNATGSSNTGGGLLQTVGSVFDAAGNPINMTPTADFDIFTDANGQNTLIGMSGQTMFKIDLSRINPNLALGTTQRVLAQATAMVDSSGGYIDIAVVPAMDNTLSFSGNLQQRGFFRSFRFLPTFATSGGTISATLQTANGTDFRFLLVSVDRNAVVATGTPSGPNKQLSFTAPAGRYALYIESATGGPYTITGNAPR